MQRLGKYVGLTPVGRGASATVYRALHQELKAVRALKVFDQSGPNQDRRVQEAVYQSRVDHPGVVRVMDLERDAETGLLYLVMEFAALGSLRNRLEEGPLETGLALELGAQMARALAQAHQQKVWHLDLKPDNILFFGPRRVKIADFGLARTPGEPLDPAWVVGTPNYMAPEQLEGRPSAASDLWALGAMLLEMLTGRLCFPGGSLSQVQASLAAGPVDVAERLALAEVSLSPDVQDLIQAMLSEDPARRPASAREVARVLAGNGPPRETVTPGPATLRISATCARCGARVPLGRELCPDCRAEPAARPGSEEPAAQESLASPTRVKAPRNSRARLLAVAAGLLLAVAVGLAFSAQGPEGPGLSGMEAASPLLPDPLPPAPAAPSPAPATESLASAPAAPLTEPVRPAGKDDIGSETPRAVQPAAPAPASKAAPASLRPAPRITPPGKSSPSVVKKKKPASSQVAARRPESKVSAPPAPAAPARVQTKKKTVDMAKKEALAPVRSVTREPNKPAARPPLAAVAKPRPVRPEVAPSYTESDLHAMLARRPGHLGARRNLALLYWQQGRELEAVSQLQIILRARPHDPEAHHALQMILAGAHGK